MTQHYSSKKAGSAGKTENWLLLCILLFSLWGAYYLFFRPEPPAQQLEIQSVEHVERVAG